LHRQRGCSARGSVQQRLVCWNDQVSNIEQARALEQFVFASSTQRANLLLFMSSASRILMSSNEIEPRSALNRLRILSCHTGRCPPGRLGSQTDESGVGQCGTSTETNTPPSCIRMSGRTFLDIVRTYDHLILMATGGDSSVEVHIDRRGLIGSEDPQTGAGAPAV